MPDVDDVLTAIRQELVTAGIVRRPSVAGALPPMHVEPIGGAPAPGEREAPEDDATTVLSISLSGELGEARLDSYRRRVVIDVRYRSKTTNGIKRAHDTDAAIRGRLVDAQRNNTVGFTLAAGTAAAINVLSLELFAGLGRISSTADRGVDEVAKYLVEVQAG